jgi:hypothetical protein
MRQPEVLIKMPASTRVLGIVGTLPFVVFGIVLLARELKSPTFSGTVFAFALLAFTGTLQTAAQRVRVCTKGDELHVRNFFRDLTFRRSEIERFSSMEPALGVGLSGRSLVVVLRDDRIVNLRVTARSGLFGDSKLNAQLRALQSWLRT